MQISAGDWLHGHGADKWICESNEILVKGNKGCQDKLNSKRSGRNAVNWGTVLCDRDMKGLNMYPNHMKGTELEYAESLERSEALMI